MSLLALVRRYLSRGARVLDPAAADQRAVAAEDQPSKSPGEAPRATTQEAPPAPHLRPDATDLEKEHRGY